MLQLAIPAFPVADLPAAVAVYQSKFGFGVVHVDDAMAILQREGIELHLWLSGDETWRTELDESRPVRSGAESFLAGTSGCRIRTTEIAVLFDELQATGVLHPRSKAVTPQPWGTLEFHTLDLDGNLLTFFQPV
jgi:catechol 2,3-dioxygenase-like lactoylglutathione lyase family enzyme